MILSALNQADMDLWDENDTVEYVFDSSLMFGELDDCLFIKQIESSVARQQKKW